ncbi:concanavalin A-like lectin/glucanase domain-containing protein, partial [Amylostereum chailletii]
LRARAIDVFARQDEYIGTGFLKGWRWETFDDPTHGRVNYVDQNTALQHNLTYATNDKFVMRADSWSNVPASARGRDSVRISSQATYDEAVFVLDLAHMPQGCATWPAFWTVTAAGPWPHGGEIDIIEGVHMATQNRASLHTLPGCTMASDRAQTGTTISTDCNTATNYNTGCGTQFTAPDRPPTPLSALSLPLGSVANIFTEDQVAESDINAPAPSFGEPFNAAGGGFYAMSKTRDTGIQVWFWPRNSPHVPPEVRWGAEIIVPGVTWGTPAASFPLDQCKYDDHFDAHQIVFDLTFCGDWAGSAWASAGCGQGTCEDFVNDNPKAFAAAYWEVNSLRVYPKVRGW